MWRLRTEALGDWCCVVHDLYRSLVLRRKEFTVCGSYKSYASNKMDMEKLIYKEFITQEHIRLLYTF